MPVSKISKLLEPTSTCCDFLIEQSTDKPAGEKYSYMEVAMLATSYAALQAGERDERIAELEKANLLTDSQRIEWATMCIRKQERIEALEAENKRLRSFKNGEYHPQ